MGVGGLLGSTMCCRDCFLNHCQRDLGEWVSWPGGIGKGAQKSADTTVLERQFSLLGVY